MNRYEITNQGGYDRIIDNVTGRKWYLPHSNDNNKICKELNELSERGDKIIEAYTNEEQLKLRWEHDIYKRFSLETIRILKKYHIPSLHNLDRKLFWRKL